MVRVPKVPLTTVGVPATTAVKSPAAVSRSARIPCTVRCSPLVAVSTSVSLASTLPVASLPKVLLKTPPASTAVPSSSTPTGVSLAPWMVTVTVVLLVAPARSEIT
ncbi:hypothetical protein D9M71_229040 [compost metagenome]